MEEIVLNNDGYVSISEAVSEGYLQNWFIDSVSNEGDLEWTKAQIEELCEDFLCIPKSRVSKCSFQVATVLDMSRMCKSINCKTCPLYEETHNCRQYLIDNPLRSNVCILEWCRENPTLTRQFMFLKTYPNADVKNGVLDICPKSVDTSYTCGNYKNHCDDCKSVYWKHEIEEE